VLVKLQVGAMSDEAKLKLIRALENSPAFKEVKVLRDNLIIDQQSGTGDLDRLHVELTVVYARS
jgi:hypothetical protein